MIAFHKGICVVEGGGGRLFCPPTIFLYKFTSFFRIKLRDQHNRDLDQVKESYEIKRRENEQV